MVKHKGASNKQTGAFKPPKRDKGLNKFKNKVDKKLKKQLSVKGNSSSKEILKFQSKEKTNVLLENKTKKKLKKKKSLKPEKLQEYSADETEGVKGSKKIKKKKSLKPRLDKYLSDEMEGVELSGDLSEQDIDSDEDFSLDESELPVPPDITTTEDESSEEENDENSKEIEPQEIPIKQDSEEQRTIFVGNLPKSVTKLQLKKWFSKYGTIEAVRLRCPPIADPSIPKKVAAITKTFHEERSNINGYVRFSKVDEAKGALAANGQSFDDTHHLRVDVAGKTGQKKQYDDKKAVFIGNLPFTAEEDRLRDHFADCGDISCIRIIRDKNTAVGKGFAYINFASRHSVRLALEKNGIEFNGRNLRIQKVVYNKEAVASPAPKPNKRINNGKNQYIRSPGSYKQVNNRDNQGKAAPGAPSTKFKKGKKNKSNEKFHFQGLSANKDEKRKKIKMKKKKFQQKKEILKKVLNNEGKNIEKVTF